MDAVPSGLRLMWDGWEKRQRFAFLRFCLVTTTSMLITGQRVACRPVPTCKLEHRKLNTDQHGESACLKRIGQFQLLLSSLPSSVLHRLFISRLHTPYFISTIFPTGVHSLAICSLPYPSSFCRSVLSYSLIVLHHMHT